jgi:hypothetical protein
VLKLLTDAWFGDSTALQGVAALVATIAIVPSAIVFVVAQWFRIQEHRESAHRFLQAEYKEFLTLALAHPKLGVGWRYEPAEPPRLTPQERHQRDILFDILTSTFETAFLVYADALRADRKRQWKGWQDYIDRYLQRDDYADWWRRAVTGEEAARPSEAGDSQYDPRFESYVSARLAETQAAPG